MKNRNFKGVWIPKEVYLDDNLSWTEKILFVEIDSLDNKDGCFASNSYFSEFVGISSTSVSTCISKLVRLGYVENLGFDGRVRILKSLMNFQKPSFDKSKSSIKKKPKRVNDKSKGSIKENQIHINTNSNTSNKTLNKDSFLYSEMMFVYNEFIKLQIGVGAKIDGQQGNAMKSIITYLKRNIKETSDEAILSSWRFIFEHWHLLDNYLQSQLKLSQINSNMLNILNQIRNGKKATSSNLESKIRNRMRNRKRE